MALANQSNTMAKGQKLFVAQAGSSTLTGEEQEGGLVAQTPAP